MKKIFTLGCILAAIVLGAMAPQNAKAAEASFIIYPQNSDYAEIWTTSYYNLIPVVGRACEVEFVIKSENVTADATISITSSDPQDVISLDKTTLLKDDMLGEGAIVKVTMTIDKPGTEYWGVKTDPLVVTLTSGEDTFANTEEITLYPVVAYANIAALRANAANFVEMATIWLENEVVIVNIWEDGEGYSSTRCYWIQDETGGIILKEYYNSEVVIGDRFSKLVVNGAVEEDNPVIYNNTSQISPDLENAPATPIVVSTKEDVLANVGKLVSIAGCNVSSENVLAKNDVEIGKVGYFEEKSTAKSVAIKNSVINLVGIVVAGGETPIICPREASDIEVLSTTAINNAEIDHTIFANEGRIYCDNDARIFTISGLDVTHMNGQLNGVYVVKTANKVAKVAVK